jgi:hypothetical protein
MTQDKKYELKVNVRVLELSKAGSAIKIDLASEDGKLGTIDIGHGSFGWRKASGKRGFQRVDWATFAKRMNEWFD